MFKATEENKSPYAHLIPESPKEPEIDAFDRLAAEQEEKDSLDPFDQYRLDLYDYVGRYYGWSWKDFDETPLWVTKGLKRKLDHRFENLEDEIFSYTYLALMLAMAKAFGGR